MRSKWLNVLPAIGLAIALTSCSRTPAVVPLPTMPSAAHVQAPDPREALIDPNRYYTPEELAGALQSDPMLTPDPTDSRPMVN